MKKKVIYTEGASKKLDDVLEKLKRDITEDITNSKNYPGEELIEITASDVEDTFDRIRITHRKSKADRMSRMIRSILPLYSVLGLLIALYGLFRDDITKLIEDDKQGLTYALLGFAISLTTGAMYFLLKQREQEKKRDILSEQLDIERQILERELEIKIKNELKNKNASA